MEKQKSQLRFGLVLVFLSGEGEELLAQIKWEALAST